ncbi:flagellar hook protein FlgE [Niveibacterium sp. 24ML]|uniref:flagellar hook protein FlgE n=1 Tax=Niveibacterium sp. 24ML TaxID=2985512 RepID=UPI002270BC8B|nr:flagellar hook protein FlgE [Niveibacterium sp. 24ML]MCX9157956.1 flagellar hook protein FlgE [Niveibacterium sp. 24ML]
MAFQQGLSGLNGASKALDVISNNVANTSTIGFKSAQTKFGDVYAAALNGAAAGVQVGIGVNVGGVSQLFNQGNITPTGNPLDLAINGNGFFRVQQPSGAISYTRNGQFEIDKSGYIVNTAGYRLQGYPANALGVILPATPTDIFLDTADLQPKQTESVRLGLNLDSRQAVPSVPFTSTPAVPLPDPLSYNSSTSVSIFDSLGNSHIYTMYFVKAGGGSWNMHTSVDGAAATGPVALNFDTSGALSTTMPIAVTATIAPSFGAVSPIPFNLDFTGSSQYGSAFGINRQTQDGFASGRLSGITIAQDGTIQGRYSNGQSKILGQTVLASFANPNGLLSLGQNLWGESPESGQPLVGSPGSGSLGLVQAGAVEESNVDITSALVDMITQQRSYQANSQSIKTQDQILQTLVNLR